MTSGQPSTASFQPSAAGPDEPPSQFGPSQELREVLRDTEELEEESKMRYVTSIERLSREEGVLEGQQEVVLSLIEERFGPLDDSIRKTVRKAGREQILRWAKRILSASSPEDVFAT